MRIRFLGTKASIKTRSRRHRRHSSLLVEADDGARLRLDAGADWLGRLDDDPADAIVLTHAHPDHAHGLKHGAPAPVHATRATWEHIEAYPIDDRRVLPENRAVRIGPFRVRGHPVAHSIRCPAVALRIQADDAVFVYAPDVIAIPQRETALDGAMVYVGDGSTIAGRLVRRVDRALVGHAPIRTQLGWCAEAGISVARFTHCGREIVTGDERRLGPQVRRLGRERGVDAAIAGDDDAMRIE